MGVKLASVLTLTAVLGLAGTAPAGTAAPIQYAAALGPEAGGATGSGSGLVTVDLDLGTLRIETSFSGLSGTVTVAHIHCCTLEPGTGTAGVAIVTPTLPGFPTGVSAGSYDMTFDLGNEASFASAFVSANGGTAAGATSALVAALDGGQAYLNIHTSTFGGGEIRGFPARVPEPAAAALLLLGLGWLARRRGAA